MTTETNQNVQGDQKLKILTLEELEGVTGGLTIRDVVKAGTWPFEQLIEKYL